MIKTAESNDITAERIDKLQTLVDHMNIFRTTFLPEPPTNYEPLMLEFKDKAVPVCMKIKKYSLDKQGFLRKLVDQLLEADLVYSNPTSKWACAPQLVLKLGPSRCRFTVDFCTKNRDTVLRKSPLPIVEHEIYKVSGGNVCANLDLIHVYWHFPLHMEN